MIFAKLGRKTEETSIVALLKEYRNSLGVSQHMNG